MKDSIEEMLQRWEEEPTPQLSLKLAEEYRRHGQLEEGTIILEQALRLHPSHVAARVAHGRFLLEMGRTDDAAQVLEAVVEEDPTHLVASKLLIGLYLQTDSLKEARDRLDLYKLLNESDPEIEMLEAQLAPAGSAGAPATAVDAAGRVFMLAGSPPQLNLQGLQVRPRVQASVGPFGDLWKGVDRDEYVTSFGAEGIFPVIVPVVAEALEPEFAEPVEKEEQPEIELVSEAEAVVEESEEEPVDLEPAVGPDVGGPGKEIGATATLGKLYLDQGHLKDAAQAFEEVLAREPGHEEAELGLAEARRQMGELASAESPLEEEALDDSGDVRERKSRVLREYLDRLRAAAGRS